MKSKSKSNDGSGDTSSKQARAVKRKALAIEERFRQAATWDLTRGNRQTTTGEQVFMLSAEIKKQSDGGEGTLEEWEMKIFSQTLPDYKPMVMEFGEENPPSGG